jgi:predicted PurR-regulated permease PerM
VVTAPDSSPRSGINHTPARAFGLSAAVLVVGGLSLAETVFAPLAFALFIIAIVWPLQERLQSIVPRLVALALTMAATILVVVAFSLLVAWALGRVGRFMVSDAERLQALYGFFALWLDGHGIAVAGLWAEYVNVSRLIRIPCGVNAPSASPHRT